MALRLRANRKEKGIRKALIYLSHQKKERKENGRCRSWEMHQSPSLGERGIGKKMEGGVLNYLLTGERRD